MTAPEPTTEPFTEPADDFTRDRLREALEDQRKYAHVPPQLQRNADEGRPWPGKVGFGAAASKALGDAPGVTIAGDAADPAGAHQTGCLYLAEVWREGGYSDDLYEFVTRPIPEPDLAPDPILGPADEPERDMEPATDHAVAIPSLGRPTVPVNLPATQQVQRTRPRAMDEARTDGPAVQAARQQLAVALEKKPVGRVTPTSPEPFTPIPTPARWRRALQRVQRAVFLPGAGGTA